MLHANDSRAPLAAAKFTAYADLGGQALLGADLVEVSSGVRQSVALFAWSILPPAVASCKPICINQYSKICTPQIEITG